MGIETRFIQAIEAEIKAQALMSVRSSRDEDKSHAYGIARGIDKGLLIAIEVINRTVANDEKDEDDDDN